MPRDPRLLGIVLAGGTGGRLDALTATRAKPALPFAGTYRLIDVALSNLVHSGLSEVWIIEQYLPHTLNRHLDNGRPWDLDRSHGGLQVLGPFQGAPGEGFAQGNSDTLARFAGHIEDYDPELVLVVSSDHLYTLDFRDVVATHLDAGADLTLVTTEVDESPTRYGTVLVGDDGRVTGFEYKPDRPRTQRVACEVFLFDARRLLDALRHLAAEGTLGDYGEDLIPHFVEHGHVVEHRHDGYWMDLGTLQSYWCASLDQLEGTGVRLDDPEWPIWTGQLQLPPARVESGASITRSLLSPGCEVHGEVVGSVVGPGVRIAAGARVENAVILDRARIGDDARLLNVLVDLDAEVAAGAFGAAGELTLIGRDGTVAARQAFDREQRLPAAVR